jgi:hypothetical protein
MGWTAPRPASMCQDGCCHNPSEGSSPWVSLSRTPVPALAFSIGRAFRSRRRRSSFASVWSAVRRVFHSLLSGAWRAGAQHSRRYRVPGALRALRDWIRCNRVSGGLLRFAAEVALDGLDQGHQLALIVAALRQFVHDNDLGITVTVHLIDWPHRNIDALNLDIRNTVG